MSRSWLWSLLAVALAAGCLLPDVSVDPELEVGSLEPMGGSGGTTNEVSNGSAGSAALAPSSSAGAGTLSASGGAGGSEAALQPVPPPQSGGAMGGTGGASMMSSAGAGGSGMRMPVADCSGSSPEEACAAYCANYSQSCGDYPAAYTYENIGECALVCNNSSWPVGNIAEKGSILCRCYHATLALNNGLSPHCYHAAEMPSMEGGCAP
jgi:hypothetical protein